MFQDTYNYRRGRHEEFCRCVPCELARIEADEKFRRVIRRIAIGATAAAMAIGAAMTFAKAADLPVKSRAITNPFAAYDAYTGFYFGGEVGYGFNLGNTGCATAFNVCDVGDLSAAPQGFVGGAFLGWGTRLPGLLSGLGLDGYFGIEGGGDIASLSGNAAAPSFIGNPLAITSKDTWLASARARFGLIYQNVMFYGTVGEGWGGATADLVTPNNTPAGSASTTQSGLTWGGGVEFPWFFGQGWKARLQYLQYDFGTLSVPISNMPPAMGAVVTQKDRIDSITIGLSYKFN
jgi:outer membrane immunogenic protein